MSFKTLLGLESCSLTEEEIMSKIDCAARGKVEIVEFSLPKRTVRIKINNVSRDGLMTEHWDYFNKSM